MSDKVGLSLIGLSALLEDECFEGCPNKSQFADRIAKLKVGGKIHIRPCGKSAADPVVRAATTETVISVSGFSALTRTNGGKKRKLSCHAGRFVRRVS